MESTPVVFMVEKFSDFYKEAGELLRLHWDEIAPYKETLTLNPDLNVYMELEAKGSLHIVTARLSKILIGYVVLIVHQHHHYKHIKIAADDIHFLHPAFRKGSLGTRLIMAAEAEMLKLGVQMMAMRTKVASDHGLLFVRLGYVALDVVYTKMIVG